MSDVLDCTNHAIPTSSMIKSMFAEDANARIHLKIRRVTGTNNIPFNCARYEDFVNLLRQAVDIEDNVVALRVIETVNSGADNTSQAQRCAQHEDWWHVFSRAFYLSDEGEVALRIMDVT